MDKKCELCGQDVWMVREYEGLQICNDCFYDLNPVRPYRTSKRANVHMNGMPACNPRPFGQLPGNTG